MIFGNAGLLMLVVGTVLAWRAERYVRRAAQLELAGGLLIVGGLSLIGIGLAWTLSRRPSCRPDSNRRRRRADPFAGH